MVRSPDRLRYAIFSIDMKPPLALGHARSVSAGWRSVRPKSGARSTDSDAWAARRGTGSELESACRDEPTKAMHARVAASEAVRRGSTITLIALDISSDAGRLLGG